MKNRVTLTAAFECREASGHLTVQHRAPVHTQPSGRSPVDWFASAGFRD